MKSPQSTGLLQLHRDGYGFVVADRPAFAKASAGGENEEDVFVPARFIGNALNGDRVEVAVIKSPKGLEGRITKILERGTRLLMGRLEQVGKHYQVIADDQRVRHRIFVANDKLGRARHGQNVVVRILRYPEKDEPMQGEVIDILGKRGEMETEVAAVIIRHQLPREFPKPVIDEADGMRLDRSAYQGRKDLTHLPFVTIDGETARDFDDAVAVEKLPNDILRLWVSIADVSHFVRPGTKLDSEAYARGTSVYFPGFCLPMLPEALSNDLCSLVPGEDRFTMTASLDIAPDGHIRGQHFFTSVIRSRRRMTYTEVKQILVEGDQKLKHELRGHDVDMSLLHRCYERLRLRRTERGSIDFDLPEPEIVLDFQGKAEDIVKAERHVGHMIIEDFMIAANEAVAEFLTAKGTGCVYRIHDRPDASRLHEFSLLLHNLGHRLRLPPNAPPKRLQEIVKAVHGDPAERLINHQLLRSMAKAVYSAENVGHYGLASRCYCHFTSPIRRYPDLVIHRLLKQALRVSVPPLCKGRLGGVDPKSTSPNPSLQRRGSVSSLHDVAKHTSARERKAMDAERDMAKLFAARFMNDRIGEQFEGVISHVTKFGMFVELIEYFVEGLIPVEALTPGRFRFEEKEMALVSRKGGKYRIGDRMKIAVEAVDIPAREIRFAPIPLT